MVTRAGLSDGGAELRSGALGARQANGPRPTAPPPQIALQPRRSKQPSQSPPVGNTRLTRGSISYLDGKTNLAGGAAMINRVNSGISKSAERLLARLASRESSNEDRFVAVGSNAARSAD